ncbi:MAG TPA: hypothetical protein VJT72_19500 [Pseudonocardiaceae bacterium]|nr:hypothetical protein [Pseudonocardiaceae bacterium]
MVREWRYRTVQHDHVGIGIIPLAILTLPLVDLAQPFPIWSDSSTDMATWFAGHRGIAIFQAFTANLAVVLLIVLAAGLTKLCADTARPTVATSLITRPPCSTPA